MSDSTDSTQMIAKVKDPEFVALSEYRIVRNLLEAKTATAGSM